MVCIMMTLAPLFLLLSCVFAVPFPNITIWSPTETVGCFRPDKPLLEECVKEFHKDYDVNSPLCMVRRGWWSLVGSEEYGPDSDSGPLCPKVKEAGNYIYAQSNMSHEHPPLKCPCSEVDGIVKRLVDSTIESSKSKMDGCLENIPRESRLL
jgi:hypothetical protein